MGGDLSDEVLTRIVQRLQLPHDTLAELHSLLSDQHATDEARLSLGSQRALRALHDHTWFFLPHQKTVVQTFQGSRPGDGFADVVFGYLMSRVLRAMEQRLLSLDILDEFPGAAKCVVFSPFIEESCPYVGPTWMDDLNINVSAPDPSVLERKTGNCTGSHDGGVSKTRYDAQPG